MARLTISFKNTEKDNETYDYWYNMEDRSAEIKPLLRAEMERRKAKGKNTENKVKSKQKTDITDF